MNPFTDYIENGYQAGKNPNGLFDVDYYLEQNTDVNIAGNDPLTHYAMFGGGEIFDSRDPNILFDSSYYLASNPDVAAAGVNPLLHYIQFGWKESRVDNPGGFNPNRDPSPFFDTSFYFETNTDVHDASFRLSSANPVQHMLEFGFTESRTTHRIFNSENVFKFSKVITPDSNPQEISNVKEDFRKINFDFTTKEDGTFEISQMSPVDDLLNPYTAIAVTFTILVGGTLFLRNQFDNSGDNTDWEALFNEDFANNTNSSAISGITIIPEGTSSTDIASISYGDPSLEDLLSGTQAFPGQTESERLLEIFTTPKVDGVEDFFILPEEAGIFISTTTEFPKGDKIIEDLLNDGLFIGSEEEPQGAYILAIETDPFAAVDKKINIDLGTVRELKVANLVGGFKVVEPGRPNEDLKVNNLNNLGDRLKIDVVGPNKELILVGGQSKANKLPKLESDLKTLKRIADSRNVTAQQYFADNTPQSAINKAVEILGIDNVFVFPDVTTQETPDLIQLPIIRETINF